MATKERHDGEALGKVLGILVSVEGSYTYVDKIAQATSKDLAMYYVRDALRDYASLTSSDKISDSPQAKFVADTILPSEIESDVAKITQLNSVPELREYLSFIASEALIQAFALENRQEYELAKSILDYLHLSGSNANPGRSDIQKASAQIKQKAREIASAIGVPEDDVIGVADNAWIIGYLLKKRNG